MAENNSSAPLKNAPMIEAFEAAYSRDWNDPTGDEIKEIWHRAWQAAAQAPSGNWINADDVSRLARDLDAALHGEDGAAPQASLCDVVGLVKEAARKLGRPVLAAQAAPAAEPLPLLVRDIARDIGITPLDACQALKGLGNFSVNSAVTADMARKLRECFPEATEDSSVGDLAVPLMNYTDAYAGAREDLSIWKRRALEAERDLRDERKTNSRLVAEINAANGPTHLGEAAHKAEVQAEPVGGQCRWKGEKSWSLCTAEHVRMALKDPRYAAEGYEVRHLYTAPQAQPADALDWAVQRWNDEVRNRPMVNIHRRSLDDTWRQVITYLGGDACKLVGPSHDDLLAAAQEGGNAAKEA